MSIIKTPLPWTELAHRILTTDKDLISNITGAKNPRECLTQAVLGVPALFGERTPLNKLTPTAKKYARKLGLKVEQSHYIGGLASLRRLSNNRVINFWHIIETLHINMIVVAAMPLQAISLEYYTAHDKHIELHEELLKIIVEGTPCPLDDFNHLLQALRNELRSMALTVMPTNAIQDIRRLPTTEQTYANVGIYTLSLLEQSSNAS